MVQLFPRNSSFVSSRPFEGMEAFGGDKFCLGLVVFVQEVESLREQSSSESSCPTWTTMPVVREALRGEKKSAFFTDHLILCI
jgi:hypothetical protein